MVSEMGGLSERQGQDDIKLTAIRRLRQHVSGADALLRGFRRRNVVRTARTEAEPPDMTPPYDMEIDLGTETRVLHFVHGAVLQKHFPDSYQLYIGGITFLPVANLVDRDFQLGGNSESEELVRERTIVKSLRNRQSADDRRNRPAQHVPFFNMHDVRQGYYGILPHSKQFIFLNTTHARDRNNPEIIIVVSPEMNQGGKTIKIPATPDFFDGDDLGKYAKGEPLSPGAVSILMRVLDLPTDFVSSQKQPEA